MKFTVERIIDRIAVLEKENMAHIEIPLSMLPDGVMEGNVLIYDGRSYTVDSMAEEQVRERIIRKQRSVFKKR